MKGLTRHGIAMLLAAGLGGCGLKGPLYLPDESTPVPVTPAAPVSSAPVSVVPPAAAPQSEAQPPAGASQGTQPQAERNKSSR